MKDADELSQDASEDLGLSLACGLKLNYTGGCLKITKLIVSKVTVIPAEAGIQSGLRKYRRIRLFMESLGFGFRRSDDAKLIPYNPQNEFRGKTRCKTLTQNRLVGQFRDQ